jgi:diguanylate cyclase (GGDEF)-like protein
VNLILGCLQGQHDSWVAAGALAICLLVSIAAMVLVGPAQVTGLRRLCLWLGALVAGIGAWTTHFMAVLAYDFPLFLSFDPVLALASALVSFGFAVLALDLQARARGWAARAGAGTVLGAGMLSMHYIGMHAMRVPGIILYDPAFVLLAVLAGLSLMAAAFTTLGNAPRAGRVAMAALLMASGIVALHLLGMASATLLPDGGPAEPVSPESRQWLASVIGAVAAVLLLSVLAVLFAGQRILRQVAAETERLRGLSDATFEAIAICDAKGRITDANAVMGEMLNSPRESLRGTYLHLLFREFPDSVLREGGRVFTALAAGTPVELLSRRIRTSGGCRVVVAVRDLRERVAAEERILHLARHDTLTGLPNRAFFLDRVAMESGRVRQGAAGFVLMCLDLDRFKAINDTYGHPAGDRVLREAARRLRAETRQEDFVARLGGDEFVLLKLEDGYPDSAADLARRIVALLSEPYDLGQGLQGAVSASIGLARCTAEAADPDELLRRADVALYTIKNGGRNGIAFYDRAMDDDMRARNALERDINLASPRGELELYWQPQRRVRDDTLMGFEALLRWHRPGEGDVAPQRFVAAAETTGAIVPIGAWVLRTACLEAARWASPLRVAVNVSAVQLQQTGFAELVEEVLRESGLEPGRLELEVTESVLIHDEEGARAVLERIKALGVRVALDDFGTGYASLGTLRAFPFDRLKIDRSFVSELPNDPAAQAVVRAILGLGQGLHMPVVAEGVESGAQLDALKLAGCQEYQGFLGGRPQPFAHYRPMVQRPTILHAGD